jgi:hypothetical protein|tara:strand:- start:1019 stop:1519 length:501 start_codon:yes stop_codon:yes gene_type:complete
MQLTKWVNEQINGYNTPIVNTPIVKSKNLNEFINLISIGEYVSVIARTYSMEKNLTRFNGETDTHYIWGTVYIGLMDNKRKITLDENYRNFVNKFFDSYGYTPETIIRVGLESLMTADSRLREFERKVPTIAEALLIDQDNVVLDRTELRESAEVYDVRPFPLFGK